jgi:hypothetical protein
VTYLSLCCFLFLTLLGLEPRAPYMLGKCSIFPTLSTDAFILLSISVQKMLCLNLFRFSYISREVFRFSYMHILRISY